MTSTTEQVVIRRLGPNDWQTWRDIRLTALADAPHAFGSSLAVEREFDENIWRSRLAPGNGMSAVAFLGESAVGAVGGYTPQWTDAVLLVAEVLAWSREQGRERVALRVADGNQPARKLFLRNGFVPTGGHEPLESDPSVGTEQLVRTLV